MIENTIEPIDVRSNSDASIVYKNQRKILTALCKDSFFSFMYCKLFVLRYVTCQSKKDLPKNNLRVRTSVWGEVLETWQFDMNHYNILAALVRYLRSLLSIHGTDFAFYIPIGANFDITSHTRTKLVYFVVALFLAFVDDSPQVEHSQNEDLPCFDNGVTWQSGSWHQNIYENFRWTHACLCLTLILGHYLRFVPRLIAVGRLAVGKWLRKCLNYASVEIDLTKTSLLANEQQEEQYYDQGCGDTENNRSGRQRKERLPIIGQPMIVEYCEDDGDDYLTPVIESHTNMSEIFTIAVDKPVYGLHSIQILWPRKRKLFVLSMCALTLLATRIADTFTTFMFVDHFVRGLTSSANLFGLTNAVAIVLNINAHLYLAVPLICSMWWSDSTHDLLIQIGKYLLLCLLIHWSMIFWIGTYDNQICPLFDLAPLTKAYALGHLSLAAQFTIVTFLRCF